MRIILAAAILVAACTPAQEREQMSSGCVVRATHPWEGAGMTYSVEATATGPDCQRAVATLIIRDSSGVPVYADAHLAGDIMMLAPAHDTAAMQTALQEWVTFDNHTMASTSALPDWPANATGPQNGEFPFYPEQAYDRDSYMRVRANGLPLFCYVQGMESQACLALADGEFSKVGVQSFPG
jgi:hypothetical protein